MRPAFASLASERGSADIIAAMAIAVVVGVSIGASRMQLTQRAELTNKWLNERALTQANYAGLEFANAAIQSGDIGFSVAPVTGALQLTLPRGQLQRVNLTTSGTTPSTFLMKTCSPRVAASRADLSELAESPGPCGGASNGNRFVTDIRVHRSVKMGGRDYLDVGAVSTHSTESEELRALLPLKVAKKSCTLVAAYNWKRGCGPGKMYAWYIYIPGASDPNSQLADMSVHGLTQFGCQGDKRPIPAVFVNPADGESYQMPTQYGPATADCGIQTPSASPLVLDLDGQGLALSLPEDGPYFDLTGDGQKHRYAWPTNPETYFLVLPQQSGAPVASVHQLFGHDTLGPDGQRARNGFEALSKRMSAAGRKQQVLTDADPLFAKLRLWSDRNRDGLADANELHTLAAKGVAGIRTDYRDLAAGSDAFGSLILQKASVLMQDGSSREVVDLWPARSKQAESLVLAPSDDTSAPEDAYP